MAEHCLESEAAVEIFEGLRQNYPEDAPETLEQGLVMSNQQLKGLGLEIRGSSAIVNGVRQRHYALVNKVPDEVAKTTFQKLYSPLEHQYIAKVLQTLAEEGEASRATLINLKSQVPSPTPSQTFRLNDAERTLQQLQDEKWIVEVSNKAAVESSSSGQKRRREGSIQAPMTLAPRAYMELGNLLVKEYGMQEDKLPQIIIH